MTKQEQYIKALEAYGYLHSTLQPRLNSTKTYSRKYVRMHKGNSIFWIGRAGAVRKGNTVTGSVAMSDSWKAKLIEGKLVTHAQVRERLLGTSEASGTYQGVGNAPDETIDHEFIVRRGTQ